MTRGQDASARRRWAAWLVESAEQAEDLTEREAQGMRIAATHLLDDEIAAKVAAIDGLDEDWLSAFTARLHGRIEAHRFAVRTVRAAAASWEDEIARLRAELERLRARVARWNAAESRDEWGARHLDDGFVQPFGDHEHGARNYVRASISRPAVLVRREVCTGPWTEVPS